MSFGTYTRLNVHVCANYFAVVRAAASKLNEQSRKSRDPEIIAARKRFYWDMLGYHYNARRLFRSIYP